MKKIISLLVISLSLVCLTACGSSKTDDESALKIIREAINKVYEKNEKLTTRNVQKYMEGNWTIVEAPENTIRQTIPKKIDESTLDDEWQPMFITACNSKTDICKDLRIMRNSDDNKLFVGSEAGAYPEGRK